MGTVDKTIEKLKDKQIVLACERPLGWKILYKVLDYQIKQFEKRR